MQSKPPTYRSYLVTFWRDHGHDAVTWRYMLQDPHSDKRQGFVVLDALLDALQTQIHALQVSESPDSHRSV